MEIDQPAALIIQDSTISGISSGYYELLDLPPNVPPSGAGDRGQPHKPKYRGNSIYLSDPKKYQASCHTTLASKDFLKSCKLELEPMIVEPRGPVRGVRICTGDKFVGVGNPPPPTAPTPPPPLSYIDYPAGYLELIINNSFLPPAEKPQDYDYNWNPVTPNGCRDVIAGNSGINALLNNIYFMVGPAVAVPPWDADKVQEISVWTQWIYWK